MKLDSLRDPIVLVRAIMGLVMNTADFRSLNDQASGIRWPQVFSLLLIDLVVLLSWMAYNDYQPRLLDRFGYGAHTFPFLLLQVLILVVTPPVAGYLTDRLLARGVGRLIMVNLGISLAALFFMATALALAGPASGWLAALFPALVVLWMLSMNLFHAPALSMLELCAPPSSLTGVAALLALSSGLVGALEPAITPLIDALGAPVTFAAGGMLALLSGSWFFRSTRDLEFVREEAKDEGNRASRFGWILATGLALGLSETLMNDLLPAWIARNGDLFPGHSPAWQSAALYAVAALAAWPLGRVGDRLTADRLAMIGGLAGLLLGSAAWMLPAGLARAALGVFPVGYSALAVAALPVAFGRLAPGHKVLGVGMLFSGIELAGGAVKLALNA